MTDARFMAIVAVGLLFCAPLKGLADSAGSGSPRATPAPTQALGLTAKTLIYNRTSLIGDLSNGLSDKINIDYGFAHGQGFDFRAELYKDGSFNEDPPFQILPNSNIYEPKLEYQLTYSLPVAPRLSAAVAMLHHHNFLFEDAYYWAIGSLTYTQPISRAMQLTVTGSAEKRLQPGALFYDGVATLDQQLGPTLKFETTIHRTRIGASSIRHRHRRSRSRPGSSRISPIVNRCGCHCFGTIRTVRRTTHSLCYRSNTGLRSAAARVHHKGACGASAPSQKGVGLDNARSAFYYG